MLMPLQETWILSHFRTMLWTSHSVTLRLNWSASLLLPFYIHFLITIIIFKFNFWVVLLFYFTATMQHWISSLTGCHCCMHCHCTDTTLSLHCGSGAVTVHITIPSCWWRYSVLCYCSHRYIYYTLCFKKKFTPITFTITMWNENQYK